MQKKIAPLSRWILLVATLILPVAYFTPIWTIKLWAPQYPEGLQMQIWINKLTGDINTINGLNHYIGMANIEEEMFPELNYLTYILGAIILLGVVTFLVNRTTLLRIFTLVLVLFAVAAIIDMYKWEYKYGHNLNPHAAIKIEGESYQPPLVGYKQLLNFLALSIPAKGGYALFASGFLAIGAAIINWRKHRKKNVIAPVLLVLGSFSLFSCTSAPEKLNFNKDDCNYCGMKLVDNRYGSLLVTSKGKTLKFDDINCMLNYKNENSGTENPSKILVIDFSQPGVLIDATKALYLKNDELKSPMGGNAAAFASIDNFNKYQALLGGTKTSWDDLQHNE
jgi:copper chaperone NosL